MILTRFDFQVPDYTLWRAQQLKSVSPERRPGHCTRMTASIYFTPAGRTLVQSYHFEEVDEPQQGCPVLCHFLGYWRDKLNDMGRMELVSIPSGGEVVPLALRYPVGRHGVLRLE